jgi:hypothetical protein
VVKLGDIRDMKKYFAAVLALIVAGSAQAQTTSINIEKSPVWRTLWVYSTCSDKEMVIEPEVTNQLKTITIHSTATNALTKVEVAKILEQELRKQADIVITPIDDKRVSVKIDKPTPKDQVLQIKSGGRVIAEVHLLEPGTLLCGDKLTVSPAGYATYQAATGPNLTGTLLFDGGEVLHLNGNVEFAGELADLHMRAK